MPDNMPDQRPPHPNPVRRFREALRLTREQFAELLDVSHETLRVWEKREPSIPRPSAMQRLIACAERNNYPLTADEVRRYARPETS